MNAQERAFQRRLEGTGALELDIARDDQALIPAPGKAHSKQSHSLQKAIELGRAYRVERERKEAIRTGKVALPNVMFGMALLKAS